MESFLEKNVISMLALVVSLFGGVPGIVGLLKRPKFHFTTMTKSGVTLDDGTKTLLIAGTVANSGEKPLIPQVYDLRVKVEGRWEGLRRLLIPENLSLNKGSPMIIAGQAAARDLQKDHRVIGPGDVLPGFLMFDVGSVPLTTMADPATEMELSCVDVYGKTHRMRMERLDPVSSAGEFPKHSVTVFPPKT